MEGGATETPLTQAQIEEAVEALFPEAVEMLSQLVAIDSQLCCQGEAKVQDFMESFFKSSLNLSRVDRFAIRLEDIKDLPGYSPADWNYDGKDCVVGVHKSRTQKGKSLILNGHVDVVPPGPSDMWSNRQPFEPVIKDGRLYGRGAGDMKAGVVAYCMALKALQSLGYAPAADLFLQSVVEEECTGNGALACSVGKGSLYKADACIIPEPFAGTIMTGQLGVMWMRIRVRGRPAHVLNTSAGINGIEAAYYLYGELKQVEERWNSAEERAKHPVYSHIAHPINFNLGTITGGEWASSVATECTFDVRIGFFPGKQLQEVREEIETAVKDAAAKKNIPYTLQWRGFQAEGCLIDPEGDMMKLLGATHKKVTNQEPIYAPVTCTTDARFFQLYQGTPATCYGPEATNIHGIDESVSLESMKQVCKVLAVFISEWCGLETL
ncbi:ArgE/DapE family deacylase [Balamuthia mandrillaris]